mmetsp:Transcript_119134/g.332399  ORF Transcript_119134/g.332399 Transcript_119134/m.332399 type:complete len:107 (-) Transcript_119134:173-493(-)
MPWLLRVYRGIHVWSLSSTPTRMPRSLATCLVASLPFSIITALERLDPLLPIRLGNATPGAGHAQGAGDRAANHRCVEDEEPEAHHEEAKDQHGRELLGASEQRQV